MRLLPDALPRLATSAPALFLDRDGVINEEIGYLHEARDCVFSRGIFELCGAYRRRGFRVLIVTNQAGLARDYYTLGDFSRLMHWMRDEFERARAPIDAVYYCPFHPGGSVPSLSRESPLRKPAPGMLLTAAREWRIELGRSVLVGDSESDVDAGLAAGVGTTVRYVPPHRRASAPVSRAHVVVERLTDAVV